MSDYSKRILAAIAEARLRLDGSEYMLIPPHIGGNETELTLVLTASEAALADGLWQAAENLNAEFGGERWPPELITFTEKIERLSHD